MPESLEKFRVLYQKGLSAFQSQNWDYAITLFTSVLDLVPEHAPARINLRLAEFRKFETYGFPLWHKISSRLFKVIPYIKAGVYWHKKDYLSVLRELEKPLRIYPKNYGLLRKLASASENAGLLETACGVYETMYILKSTDLYPLKRLGRLYHELNQPDKARNYYEKALSVAPTDYEARKGLQDIAALGTIAKGWEETGTYRAKILDEKQAELFEKEAKLIRSDSDTLLLIKDLEKRFAEQPNNITIIKNIAGLYSSIRQYDKALQFLSQIKTPDPEISKEIFNIKMAKLKDRPELQEKLILEETQNRVKQFPTHLPLRYEMGTVYMGHEMLDKAIGEFQLSVKDPKYKILSLNNLGLCFFKKGIHDLAISQFQKANSELHEWDELKKEIVYNLGVVYESLGEREKALAEYKKIYEQDIHYRDIAKKISI